MTKYRHTEEEYRKAVAQSTSIADVCRILDILPRGGNYVTIQKKIALYNIDASHFLGSAHNRGKTFVEFPVGKLTIKKRMIVERGHRCESCKNTEWLGKPIALELEHIDGNNTNHIDSNLLLLCPNCHAQTPTWKRGKASFEDKPELVCPGCEGAKSAKASFCKVCSPKYQPRPLPKYKPILCACGTEISAKSFQCSECLHKAQERIVWPAPEELATRLHSTSYTALGRELGVSDNAIRKYLRKHGYDTKTLQKVDPTQT